MDGFLNMTPGSVSGLTIWFDILKETRYSNISGLPVCYHTIQSS